MNRFTWSAPYSGLSRLPLSERTFNVVIVIVVDLSSLLIPSAEFAVFCFVYTAEL